MRQNYFVKLVRYMKSVYRVDRGLNKLSDGNPTYSTSQAILPVLFGFLLRIKSFNELNFMIKNHEFSQRFPRGTKLPQIDAIRDTLKVVDLDGLKKVNQHILKTAVENMVFENGTIDGYLVAACEWNFSFSKTSSFIVRTSPLKSKLALIVKESNKKGTDYISSATGSLKLRKPPRSGLVQSI